MDFHFNTGLNETGNKSYVEKWDKDLFESAAQMVKGSLLVESVDEQKRVAEYLIFMNISRHTPNIHEY